MDAIVMSLCLVQKRICRSRSGLTNDACSWETTLVNCRKHHTDCSQEQQQLSPQTSHGKKKRHGPKVGSMKEGQCAWMGWEVTQ